MVFKLPECTLCGKHVTSLNKIELEGAIVEVCDECVRFGRRIEVKINRKIYKPLAKEVNFSEIITEGFTLASDYGKRIREARESLGLTRMEFAKKINERESIIRRLERQTMEPDEKLTEKIERFLHIKLKEEYD